MGLSQKKVRPNVIQLDGLLSSDPIRESSTRKISVFKSPGNSEELRAGDELKIRKLKLIQSVENLRLRLTSSWEGFWRESLAGLMAARAAIKSGTPVSLAELSPESPFFNDGASLRVTGKLQDYSIETGVATLVDGDAKLEIDTQHLRELTFRTGSTFLFIGELLIKPDNEAVLQARVGRNVDGMDIDLYRQSLPLLRQFQVEHPVELYYRGRV
ncbi:CST complex subunit TEN1 [Linum perenne]